MKYLLLLAALTPLFAADPAGFKLWKGSDLKAYTKTEPLGDFGNHTVLMNHRDASNEAEVHDNWTDVMVIESGEAVMMIGGTLVDPKTTAPGEHRAATATGAEKKILGPGDIVHIPAGTPHQFIIAPGKQITYFAMKVPAAK